MAEVAAIIVTYNRKDKLRRCLEAVFAQSTATEPDVFIVDNGSSDGTEEMVHEIIKAEEKASPQRRIIYENLHYNSGGAGGFRHGMMHAAEEGYEYMWLMDDDSIPSESALGELLRFRDSHIGKYGFLSSKVLWNDGMPCQMNVQRKTMYRDIKSWDMDYESIVMASFVSLFVPTKVALNVGFPIKEFFIWTDDWEYTRRISRKYRCYLVTKSIVTHDCESPDGANIAIATDTNLDRYRYLYRNDVYLYRREGISGLCYESARLIWHTMKILKSKNSLKGKAKRIGIMVGGTIDGLRMTGSFSDSEEL